MLDDIKKTLWATADKLRANMDAAEYKHLVLLYETGLQQLDGKRAMNHRQIRALAALRDTLLPRLISGQLRLPDGEHQIEDHGP